ncbi:type I restriction-modification system specificity protein [Haemophilus influenzae]|uniref:restriction endonuclease subunit S n=1 Tax=Haemophilus influenzae TaxID=727 RepID=UPI000DA28064|nr:restriction endonuclease subunit S [Haemophilus influenzae]UEB29908.1 restriction endonuclease subunit S [Haemophilus influenzae]SQG87940.1 type I restriction-modification system specificity protein [Haemophilus influenzae]
MKNNRTFLEKLLDGAEVEWKPLDEVANIANNARKPVKSSLRISGNIPYYGANNIQDYVEGYTHDGEFVLIAEDGSASLENYSIQSAVGKFWANNHVHVVNGKEKLNNRFLYHYLTNMNFIPFLAGKERAKLTKAKLQQIPIPIPPLSVQTEIVRILDALTALTSELILRQKQYEYYREKLLSFDSLEQLNSGRGKKKLIDVAYFQNGKGHEKNIDENGSFIVINSKFISTNGTIKKYCNDQLVPLFKEDILIVMSDLPNGKALAKTFFVTEDNKYTLNQRIGRITVKKGGELLPSFVNHFLNRNKQLTKYDNGTDQTNLRKDQILDVVIPIPPLKEQHRIVSILDKFETLTNSITEGLPLAIEQSQKRYEYYRELLLSFS